MAADEQLVTRPASLMDLSRCLPRPHCLPPFGQTYLTERNPLNAQRLSFQLAPLLTPLPPPPGATAVSPQFATISLRWQPP